jgi:hypothetical protein
MTRVAFDPGQQVSLWLNHTPIPVLAECGKCSSQAAILVSLSVGVGGALRRTLFFLC